VKTLFGTLGSAQIVIVGKESPSLLGELADDERKYLVVGFDHKEWGRLQSLGVQNGGLEGLELTGEFVVTTPIRGDSREEIFEVCQWQPRYRQFEITALSAISAP